MLQNLAAQVPLIVLGALTLCVLGWFRCERRLRVLERNLQQCYEALGQMVEIQMNEHRRVNGNLNDIEERIWNLTAPETHSASPLDRKHQVLTLSGKGFGLEEITNRLKIPKGDAELILNLKKYFTSSGMPSARPGGENKRHAEAQLPS